MGNPKSVIEIVNMEPRNRNNRMKFTLAVVFIIIVTMFTGWLLVLTLNISTAEHRPTTAGNPTVLPNIHKSGNPGAILRAAKNLLIKYVYDASDEAEKLNDVAFGDVVLPLSNGQIIISHLRLTSLTLPISLNALQSPSDVLWGIKKGRLSASGTWNSRQNIGKNTFNSTGFLNVPPIDHREPSISYSGEINTTMGRNSDNQPIITKVACCVYLNKPKMDFSSPKSQARYALIGIQTNLTEMIKRALEACMCDVISGILETSLNKFLSTFQAKIQLWNEPKIMLNYSLLADPFVDPVYGSINALLNGSIYVDSDNALTIYPHEMPFVANNIEQSVTIMFSDYILNSLFTSVYQANPFRLMTINNTLSKTIANYFKITCEIDELCVGSVFRSLSSYPAGAYADISFSISQLPLAVFLESGAQLQLAGTLFLDIKSTDQYKGFNRYASPFSLIAALTPGVRSDKYINAVFAEASLVELNLVNAVPMGSHDKIKELMTPILEETLNELLREGIPLPILMNNRLRNHDFTFFNHSLLMFFFKNFLNFFLLYGHCTSFYIFYC